MAIHINHRHNALSTGSNAESFGVTLEIRNTGSLIVPKGTTAQRPSTPVAGMFRFNTNTNSLEVYGGTGWNTIFAGNVEDLLGTDGEYIVDGVTVGSAAANHVRITNALTGGAPVIAAAGTDLNINLHVNSKGTGRTLVNSALSVGQSTSNFNLNIDTVTSGIKGTVTNGGELFLQSKNLNIQVSGAGSKFTVRDESNNNLLDVVASGSSGLLIEAGGSETRLHSPAGSLFITTGANLGTVTIGNSANRALVVDATTPGPYLRVTTGASSVTVWTSGTLVFNTDQPNFEFSNKRLSNVANPVAGTDAANKNYVDAAINGLDWKQSVKVATTTNLAELSGLFTVDGYTLVSGDRILVKNQIAATANGIYVAVPGTWSRAPDADQNDEVTPGLAVFVEQGSVNADTGWLLITDSPIILGDTNLTFTQFAGPASITLSAGAGIAVSQSGTEWTVSAVVDNQTVWTSAPNGTGKSIGVFAPDAISRYSVLIAPASAGPQGRSAVWGKVNLASNNAVENNLPVDHGGTGLNAVANQGLLVGTGGSSLSVLSVGAASTSDTATVLVVNNVGNVAWGNVTLNQLSDVTVSGATTGDVLRFNGTEWVAVSAAVTDRLVAVNSAATPSYLVDVLIATTSGAITFTSAGNTLRASVNYDDSRIIVVGNNLTVGNGVTGQVLIGTGSALAANWGYLDTLRNTTGSALFVASGTGGAGSYEVSAQGAVLRQGGDTGLGLVATSGHVYIDSVRYPKTAPAHSVLVANTNNILTPLTTGGNENRVLIYNASTSAFAFVSAGFIGVSDSFGVFALSGNFTGSATVSAVSQKDTLTLIGGNGINLTGANTTRNITVSFANVNMSSVPVAFDDKVVLFDTSNSDKPEHRTFKGIFNDLSVPHNVTTLGITVQVSAGEWTSRSLVANTSADRTGIEVLFGNGVAGNPTIGLAVETLTEVNQTAVSPDTDYVLLYKSSNDQNVRTKVSALIYGTIDHTRIWDAADKTSVDTDEIPNVVLIKSDTQRVATFVGTSAATSARNYFEFDTATSANAIRIEAQGTGADISIRLLPKGNGSVIVGETLGPATISTDIGQDLILNAGRNIQLIPTSTGSFLGEVKIYAASSAELVVFDNRKVRQYNVGNVNSYKDSYVVRLTTNNSSTARYSVKLPNNSTILAYAYVVGLGDSNTNRLGMKLDALCYVVTSTASLLDNVAQTLVATSGGPMDATFVVSGDSIELQVLGASATTNWTGFIDIVTVI